MWALCFVAGMIAYGVGKWAYEKYARGPVEKVEDDIRKDI